MREEYDHMIAAAMAMTHASSFYMLGTEPHMQPDTRVSDVWTGHEFRKQNMPQCAQCAVTGLQVLRAIPPCWTSTIATPKGATSSSAPTTSQSFICRSVSHRVRRSERLCCKAVVDGSGGSDEDGLNTQAAREQLQRMFGNPAITGTELRELVYAKWGKTYDVRLCRRGKRFYVQVMWRHLEQASFPLTEAEYNEQLDVVAAYVNAWGMADTVRSGIKAASVRGPGFTGGGGARAVSIPLQTSPIGDRSDEWDL